MDFQIDRRPIATPTFHSLEPSHLWVLGLVNDRAPERLSDRVLTYPPECECPDDCRRDHENE